MLGIGHALVAVALSHSAAAHPPLVPDLREPFPASLSIRVLIPELREPFLPRESTPTGETTAFELREPFSQLSKARAKTDPKPGRFDLHSPW